MDQIKAPEAVRGAASTAPDNLPGTVVYADPTQMRRPWRTTARTLFQALVALCVLFPILVENTGLKVEDVPWLAIPLAVTAAVARIMALPQVEVFLRTFLPFLSAAPKEN
jgi:hypothetical protein